jgi:DNA-binding NarL/FixJ family response regulator
MLPTAPITVAVLDDNRLVREALTGMLGRVPDLRVVALDPDDPGFVAGMTAQVLLLDVGLRDQDSRHVASALKRAHPGARIIVMDLLPVNEEIRDHVNAGVSGFVLKDATFEELVATIRAVAGGAKVLPPTMTESLFAQIAREVAALEPARIVAEVRMTRREREVIFLIGEGLSNKELAQRLNLATHTVKSHVRNVMAKLTLHTRLQIAAYSHREGAA